MKCPTNIRINALEIAQVAKIHKATQNTDAEMKPATILHRALMEGLAARVNRLIEPSVPSSCARRSKVTSQAPASPVPSPT